MEKKQKSADALARLEAKYGPFPSMEEVLERRLAEEAEARERQERRRRRLRRLTFGLLPR